MARAQQRMVGTPPAVDDGEIGNVPLGGGPALELQRLLVQRLDSAFESGGRDAAVAFPHADPADSVERIIALSSRLAGPVLLAATVLALAKLLI